MARRQGRAVTRRFRAAVAAELERDEVVRGLRSVESSGRPEIFRTAAVRDYMAAAMGDAAAAVRTRENWRRADIRAAARVRMRNGLRRFLVNRGREVPGCVFPWVRPDGTAADVRPAWDGVAPIRTMTYPATVQTYRRGGRGWWVTVYEVTREWGGPEEGGWHWDRWEPVAARKCRTPEHARRMAAVAAHVYGDDRPPVPLSSVLSRGEYRVVIERRRAGCARVDRPRYE